MLYELKVRRKGQWFWRTFKKVKGHNVKDDILDIFFNDGIRTIHKFSECDIKLGSDFILKQKEDLERESGQSININKD